MDAALLPVAHGGLAIADRDANRLFQAAATRIQQETTVGSIPVPAIGDNAAFVLHLLPLRRPRTTSSAAPIPSLSPPRSPQPRWYRPPVFSMPCSI
jgi:hypothetical protein